MPNSVIRGASVVFETRKRYRTRAAYRKRSHAGCLFTEGARGETIMESVASTLVAVAERVRLVGLVGAVVIVVTGKRSKPVTAKRNIPTLGGGGRTRTKTRSLPPPITDRLPWPFIRVSAAAEFTIEANVRGDGTVTFDSTGIFHSAYRKRYSNRPDNDGPVTGTRGGTLSRRTGGDRGVRISILCSAVTGAWRG